MERMITPINGDTMALMLERIGAAEEPAVTPPPPPVTIHTGDLAPLEKRIEWCRNYLAKCAVSMNDGHGNRDAVKAAAKCFEFGLTEQEMFPLLQEWNAGCQPEWSEQELLGKIKGGRKEVDRTGTIGTKGQYKTDHQKSGNREGLSASPTPNKRKTHNLPTNREYQKFPVGALPGIVAEFIQGTADAINVDESFIGMPVLAVMGAAVGGARQVLIKKGYPEPAVIWGAVVANSGTKKSPALDAPCKAVIKAEMRNVAIYEEAKAQYDAQVANHKADLADWQRNGKKKGEPAPELPEAPICRRFIVSDITKEALAPKLKDNPRGLLSKHDELSGFFGAMNQYKAGKGNDEAAWLSMFGARELIVDRKGSGSIVIPRAPVSIIGGIQPEILKRLLTREHFESGMSARFLLAYPPPRVSLWTEDEVGEELEKSFADMIQKLQRLDYEIDEEDGSLIPVYCPLTTEAKAAWIEFYNENAIETSKLTGDLSAAWPKLCGYAARFALIIRFARWAQSNEWEPPKCIDLESLQAGIVLSQWFANETRRVYSLLGESPEERARRELIELITRLHGGSITPRDLAKSSRLFDTSEEAEVALQDLVNHQLGQWQTATANTGPASRRFEVSQNVGELCANPEENAGLADNEGQK